MKRLRLLVLAGAACWGCEPGADKPPAPADAPAAIARARELRRRHRLQEALDAVEACLGTPQARPAADAGVQAALRLQATLLADLARPREAAAILEDLARREPSDPLLPLQLASVHLDLGNFTRSVSIFEALPRESRARARLEFGSALAGAGRPAEGAAVLAALLIQDPWNDAGCLALGRALVRAGQTGGAEPFLARYRASEAWRQAEQKILEAESLGQEAQALYLRGKAESERGRLFEAMGYFNRALGLDPGLGRAYLELARISIILERPDDAIRVLKALPADPQVLEVLAAAEESRRSFAADALGDLRRQAQEEMRGVPLSRCAPALLRLASGLDAAGRAGEARRLALFSIGLDPRSPEARELAARLFSGPGELFIRLWARLPMQDAAGREGRRAELAGVPIDAGLVEAHLGAGLHKPH